MKYPIKEVGIKHLDWVSLVLSTGLPSSSKMLAMYLSRFMNKDQDIAWPSLARITHETSMHKATVCRHLSLLEEEGWLIREKGGPSKNTRYMIGFPEALEKAMTTARDTLGSRTVRLGSRTERLGVVAQCDTNQQYKSTKESYIVGQKPNHTKIQEITQVVVFLNMKTGKAFNAKTPSGDLTATGTAIGNLLKSGYTVQDMKTVIARKAREWGGDPKMASYLRPKTLFAKSNFENYHGECV